MRNVILFSVLLLTGLLASQVIDLNAIGNGHAREWLGLLTMAALSFIMIRVGFEFDIDKTRPGIYAWDCFVALCAAALPWLFCACYFAIFLPSHSEHGRYGSAVLEGLFAAPTSAGVLFSMLAAAGLRTTWLFRKARVLAIFDDLHTVILLLPVQAVLIGFRWQLVAVAGVVFALLAVAWRFLRKLDFPATWPWVIAYSAGLVAITESIARFSMKLDPAMPLHIEVLLPAFVLGCVNCACHHVDEEPRGEVRASTIVGAVFMLLVGLSMPKVIGQMSSQDDPSRWSTLAVHVLAITFLSNLGKMIPALCYRREASGRERAALAIGMFPRGEVGAGVLVIALNYGIAGNSMTVAVLSLALNLVCTGFVIYIVKKLLSQAEIVPTRG